MSVSRWIPSSNENCFKRCWENQNAHFSFSNFFSRRSCRLWYVEKCGGAREYPAFARKHTLAPVHPHFHARALTHKYVIITAFPPQQWFPNAPHCYVIHTLSVLFRTVVSTFCRAVHLGPFCPLPSGDLWTCTLHLWHPWSRVAAIAVAGRLSSLPTCSTIRQYRCCALIYF